MIVLIALGHQSVRLFFFHSIYSQIIYYTLAIPTSVSYIKNHIICYKRDAALQGLLLIIFNLFYNPFYFLRIIKKGWI